MPTSLTAPGIVASLCVAAAFALCASEASAEPAAARIQREAKPPRERQRPQSKDIDEQRAKVERLQRELQQREESNKGGDIDKLGRWMVGDGGGGDVEHALRREAASTQKAIEQLKARQSGIDLPMRELQGAQVPLGKPRLTTTRPCQPAPDCGAARIAPR